MSVEEAWLLPVEAWVCTCCLALCVQCGPGVRICSVSVAPGLKESGCCLGICLHVCVTLHLCVWGGRCVCQSMNWA